jgi:hypothetical protein
MKFSSRELASRKLGSMELRKMPEKDLPEFLYHEPQLWFVDPNLHDFPTFLGSPVGLIWLEVSISRSQEDLSTSHDDL